MPHRPVAQTRGGSAQTGPLPKARDGERWIGCAVYPQILPLPRRN